MEDQIRAEIENAVIALETAQQAYHAAVESRDYQQQLLRISTSLLDKNNISLDDAIRGRVP